MKYVKIKLEGYVTMDRPLPDINDIWIHHEDPPSTYTHLWVNKVEMELCEGDRPE